MIKGIIIDVDGVIVGEKPGVNFPDPNPKIIERLKSIRAKGTPISLCTAKPHAAIQKVVTDAGLNNLHITQGGGVVIDPIDNVILKAHSIDKDAAKHIMQICLDRGNYVEFYSPEAYFIQANQKSDFTDLHTSILGVEPIAVSSLIDEADKHDIVKIMPIASNDDDMNALDELFEPYKAGATISWGAHPVALPRRFGIITALGISKGQAAAEVAEHEHIAPSELLGVGDSTADWQFIEHCGYAGAMGNASDELKKLVATKGDKSFVGGGVDDDGLLDILDHFGL
jgi:HAD superfamily hydrolase (TIGR01484 family)